VALDCPREVGDDIPARGTVVVAEYARCSQVASRGEHHLAFLRIASAGRGPLGSRAIARLRRAARHLRASPTRVPRGRGTAKGGEAAVAARLFPRDERRQVERSTPPGTHPVLPGGRSARPSICARSSSRKRAQSARRSSETNSPGGSDSGPGARSGCCLGSRNHSPLPVETVGNSRA
jgi:hypothetical protein